MGLAIIATKLRITLKVSKAFVFVVLGDFKDEKHREPNRLIFSFETSGCLHEHD